MRSQPNSSSFYISAALCGVPCTRILDDVSECKLRNTKHIFQLDVSIPNLNLLWWVEAERMLKRNQHLWNGRSCNSFALSCSLASLVIQRAEHTRKKWHISWFLNLRSHHFSPHWHLLGHWQPEWDVAVLNFPPRALGSVQRSSSRNMQMFSAARRNHRSGNQVPTISYSQHEYALWENFPNPLDRRHSTQEAWEQWWERELSEDPGGLNLFHFQLFLCFIYNHLVFLYLIRSLFKVRTTIVMPLFQVIWDL